MTMMLTVIMRVMTDDACASLSPQHRAPGCEQRPLDTEPEPEPVSAWKARWHRDRGVSHSRPCHVTCDVQSDSNTWQVWHLTYTALTPEFYIVLYVVTLLHSGTYHESNKAVRFVTFKLMSFKDCLFLLSSFDIDPLNISIENHQLTLA